MYGETVAAIRAFDREEGLSPHVRGNRPSAQMRNQFRRSIPACTGKPVPTRRGATCPGVYPRMYGETRRAAVAMAMPRGLSPHVRGNPGRRRLILRTGGSIPACTGKPGGCCAGGRNGAVYPRMYGETLPNPEVCLIYQGLSPHVRGNL